MASGVAVAYHYLDLEERTWRTLVIEGDPVEVARRMVEIAEERLGRPHVTYVRFRWLGGNRAMASALIHELRGLCEERGLSFETVSYTHLTLPTN